jgi:hypothetical protein
MYQRYPSSTKAAEPDRGPVPPSIQNAAKLMYAGAGLTAVSLIVLLATTGDVKAAVHKANPSWTAHHVSSFATNWIVTNLVAELIGIGLWIMMARMNLLGRVWARIVATVLFGLNTLGGLNFLRGGVTGFGAALFGLIWLVGLGAIVLLWLSQSTAYFNSQRDIA